MARIALFALIAAAALITSVHADEATVKQLRQERLALLAERVALLEARLKADMVDFQDLVAVRAAYLDARLELAETREERLEILRKSVENAEQLVAVVQSQFEIATISRDEVLAAKVELLNRKIALEIEMTR